MTRLRSGLSGPRRSCRPERRLHVGVRSRKRSRTSSLHVDKSRTSMPRVSTSRFAMWALDSSARRSRFCVTSATAGHANADVENLLAQSYVGDGQQQLAFDALRRAASLTPTNEKLYLFVGDACMDRHDYEFGLKVVELGLKNLPDSARLHYQRGLFLSLLDEFDRAREDFARARQLAPGSETSFLAAANEELYAGNPEAAAKQARAGIAQGYENPVLLTILGEALIRSGVRPGEIGFTEAQIALEKAVAQNPRDPGAEVSLGKIYLMADRLPEAIAHLERARELKPDNPSVYANLATAYRRRGNATEANEALQILAKLNQAQAERISSAPGDRKAAYGEQRIEKEVADHKN